MDMILLLDMFDVRSDLNNSHPFVISRGYKSSNFNLDGDGDGVYTCIQVVQLSTSKNVSLVVRDVLIN